MEKKLPPVHPGEILRKEFLVPRKLTPEIFGGILLRSAAATGNYLIHLKE